MGFLRNHHVGEDVVNFVLGGEQGLVTGMQARSSLADSARLLRSDKLAQSRLKAATGQTSIDTRGLHLYTKLARSAGEVQQAIVGARLQEHGAQLGQTLDALNSQLATPGLNADSHGALVARQAQIEEAKRLTASVDPTEQAAGIAKLQALQGDVLTAHQQRNAGTLAMQKAYSTKTTGAVNVIQAASDGLNLLSTGKASVTPLVLMSIVKAIIKNRVAVQEMTAAQPTIGSLVDRLQTYVGKMTAGEMTPEVFNNLKDVLDRLAKGAQGYVESQRKFYSQAAKSQGFDAGIVTGGVPTGIPSPQGPAARAAAPAPADPNAPHGTDANPIVVQP